MRKFAIAVALAVGIVALVSIVSASATTTSFTVSPWAYACSTTHYGNPASNTDPGSTCDHNGTEAGLGTGYCGDPSGSAVDSPGTVSAAYTAGALTLTKVGPICDDMASGATIGGLSTLTAASADCLTLETCNPGGNLRLNVIDSTGKLHFIGGTMTEGHITFSVGELEGLALKSIDVIADNPGTVTLNNLSFAGAPTPTPTPSPTPSATPTPSASAHPTATPHPTAVPVLAQTGGGVMDAIWPNVALALALALIIAGLIVALVRRRRTS